MKEYRKLKLSFVALVSYIFSVKPIFFNIAKCDVFIYCKTHI